ncbi:DUF222 domain-containing protein [Propionibacteriaceae bacterium Y2011]
MSSDATEQPAGTPATALAALEAGLTAMLHLTETDLTGLDPDQLLGLAQGFEQVRNRMALVDHTVVAACTTTNLADRQGFGSTARLLAGLLRIADGEAKARTTAATQLRPDTTFTGETVPTQRPALAAAQETGLVSPQQMSTALRALAKVEKTPRLDTGVVEQAERDLAEHAVLLSPRDFRRYANKLVDVINPDGTRPDDEHHEAHRGLAWYEARDGSWRIEGRITPALGHKLDALLDPLSLPHEDGPEGPDTRDPGQRRHDALEMIIDRFLRGDLPNFGGTPVSVIVNIDHQDLVDRTGHGTYADGTPIHTTTLMNLADEATVIPAWLAANGAVLDLGRTQRIANKAITHALHARDQGCSFPGCHVEPQWCERHHVIAWLDGGETKITNMTLLCRYHHHNFERLRWTCRLIDGIPWWIPPAYIDPQQKPILNSRIAQRAA